MGATPSSPSCSMYMTHGLDGDLKSWKSRKRRQRVAMTSEQRQEAPSVADSILQICAFALTSYPVLAPLLRQLREDLREAFDRAADIFPRLRRALSELELDEGVADRLTNQLLEAVPELESLLQRLRS